jgi:hypothetical protein
MAMLNMKPGDTVRLTYRRKALFGEPTDKVADVVLR